MGRLLGHFQAMDLLAMGYGPLLPALWGTAPQLLGQLQCRPGCHAVPASAWQQKAGTRHLSLPRQRCRWLHFAHAAAHHTD